MFDEQAGCFGRRNWASGSWAAEDRWPWLCELDAIQLAGTEGVVDDQPAASAAMFGMHEQRTLLRPRWQSQRWFRVVSMALAPLSVQLFAASFGSSHGFHVACQILPQSTPTEQNAMSKSPSNRASDDGNASAGGTSTIRPRQSVAEEDRLWL